MICYFCNKILEQFKILQGEVNSLTTLGFNYSVNCTYKNILEINQAIKIDLADPINSGLLILNRLLKLLAFS